MAEKELLLVIETTGAKASVALIDKKGVCRQLTSEDAMNHLRHLIPMIDKLLCTGGKRLGDLCGIAVSEGPGSFTGIRIGMATAGSLAQALDLPVVGVPTLESFVYHAPAAKAIISPIFDARRNQIYAGAYAWDNDGSYHNLIQDKAYDLPEYINLLRRVLSDGSGNHFLDHDFASTSVTAATATFETNCATGCAHHGRETLEEVLEGTAETDIPLECDIVLFGDGIKPYGEQIRQELHPYRVEFAEETARYQNAASVALLARRLWEQGKQKSLYDLHPVYLRKAEAQRKLEEAAGK